MADSPCVRYPGRCPHLFGVHAGRRVWDLSQIRWSARSADRSRIVVVLVGQAPSGFDSFALETPTQSLRGGLINPAQTLLRVFFLECLTGMVQ